MQMYQGWLINAKPVCKLLGGMATMKNELQIVQFPTQHSKCDTAA
jgi:hypothetical protein